MVHFTRGSVCFKYTKKYLRKGIHDFTCRLSFSEPSLAAVVASIQMRCCYHFVCTVLGIVFLWPDCSCHCAERGSDGHGYMAIWLCGYMADAWHYGSAQSLSSAGLS